MVRRFDSPEELRSVCFTSDGTVFAGYDYHEQRVSFFEFPSLKLKRTLPLEVGEHPYLTRIAISLEANLVAVSEYSAGTIQFFSRPRFRAWMEFLVEIMHAALVDVGIDLGRRDAGVTEHLLKQT